MLIALTVHAAFAPSQHASWLACAHAPSPFGGGAGRASAMVVVENPPTLDHAGTPRSNMAVGVVCED